MPQKAKNKIKNKHTSMKKSKINRRLSEVEASKVMDGLFCKKY